MLQCIFFSGIVNILWTGGLTTLPSGFFMLRPVTNIIAFSFFFFFFVTIIIPMAVEKYYGSRCSFREGSLELSFFP